MKKKKSRVQMKTPINTLISLVANSSTRGKQSPPPPPKSKTSPPQRNPAHTPQPSKSWAAVAAKPQRQIPKSWGKAALRQPDWDLPVTDALQSSIIQQSRRQFFYSQQTSCPFSNAATTGHHHRRP